MKQLIMCLFLALSFMISGCVSNALPPKMTSPQLADFTASESVALVAISKHEAMAFCSGVWISQNMILTANHCVEGYVDHINDLFDMNQEYKDAAISYVTPSEVNDIGWPVKKSHFTSVYYLDTKDDLAILKAVGDEIPEHRSAKLAASSPIVGSDVYTNGSPSSAYFSFRKGMVSAYRNDMSKAGLEREIHGPFLQACIAISFGDSGGGLFDEDGNLIGIASFMSGEAQDTGFYIHLQTIRKLMMEHQLLPIPLDKNQKDPD